MTLLYLPQNSSLDEAVDRLVQQKEVLGCKLNKTQARTTLKYFQGDELGSTVFLKKYALRDEEGNLHELTLGDSRKRWTKSILEVDPGFTEAELHLLFRHFFPAGRQMLALGNPYIKGTVNNCYTKRIKDDSLEGIFDAAYQIARTFSWGGGEGLCLGQLRPNKSKVSNTARFSTGSLSFGELFAYVTAKIGQDGRRGALMLTIPIEHPDVEDFIEVKHGNIDKLRDVNTSIKISDEFLQAVQEGKQFRLHFKTPHEVIERWVDAQALWQKIIQAARDSAEPGILFWDRIVEESPSDNYVELKVVGTNPCQPKDATVLTPQGIRTIGSLNIGDEIWSGKQWTKVTNKIYTGIKPVYRFSTTSGFFLGTKDHKIFEQGQRVQVGEATYIDTITGPRYSLLSTAWTPEVHLQGIMDGLVLGDGSVHKASGNLVYLCIGEKDHDYFNSEVSHLIGLHRPGLKETAWEVVTSIQSYELPKTYQRRVPNRYLEAEFSQMCAFLRGIYSANGSVVANRITLKTASIQIVRDVQVMLSALGIQSYYTTNKEHPVKFKNGVYICKESYDLNISTDREKFLVSIGFIQKYKQARLLAICSLPSGKTCLTGEIRQTDYIGEEEVFDITVEAPEHSYWTGGLLVSNCGEQPLDDGGACCLGALCLDRFVDNPFTQAATFNFDLFIECVGLAVRYLDDIVEIGLQKHPLKDQSQQASLGRRIGLGITGLADMFLAMGMTYGSKECIPFFGPLMRLKCETEYKASMLLAKERGSFPLFNPDLHYSRGVPSRLPDTLKAFGREHGQRNVTLSTIAPSGSVAIVAQASSGIEPIYSKSMSRVVELGGKRHAFQVIHPGIARYMKAKKLTSLKDVDVPTAYSIPAEGRVALQACAQNYIDSAISSTVNVPRETTTEEIRRIYELAWKERLKGITVYREGSREGILLESPEHKQKLDTATYKFMAEGGDKFYVHISYKDGDIRKPYQVFTINYKAGDNDRFVKVANALHRMLIGKVDDQKIGQQLTRSTSSLVKLTRLLSLGLKNNLLDDILPILGEYAFAGSLASRLKGILEVSSTIHIPTCSECGSKNVKVENGCMCCNDCGNSRCS